MPKANWWNGSLWWGIVAACIGVTGAAAQQPATIGTVEECFGLWYDRNRIFSQAGYCHFTPLGVTVFDNSSCSVERAADLRLSGTAAAEVARLRDREFLLGCNTDTRIPDLLRATEAHRVEGGEDARACGDGFMRLRTAPTSAAEGVIIAEIPNGTVIRVLERVFNPARSHQWFRVVAPVDGVQREGFAYHTGLSRNCPGFPPLPGPAPAPPAAVSAVATAEPQEQAAAPRIAPAPRPSAAVAAAPAASTSRAQALRSDLPLEARIDIALLELETAIAAEDHEGVLAALDVLEVLVPGLDMPEIEFYRITALEGLGRIQPAHDRLIAFLQSLDRSDPLYPDAVAMLLTLERKRDDYQALSNRYLEGIDEYRKFDQHVRSLRASLQDIEDSIGNKRDSVAYHQNANGAILREAEAWCWDRRDRIYGSQRDCVAGRMNSNRSMQDFHARNIRQLNAEIDNLQRSRAEIRQEIETYLPALQQLAEEMAELEIELEAMR